MSGTSGEARGSGRLEEARRWFRAHHAGIEPDAGFAGRVSRRLQDDPALDLGRAAMRLLPATLALALLLTWAALRPSPVAPAAGPASSDIDVVAWVYGAAGSSPGRLP